MTEKTIKETIADRGSRYGAFEDHAYVTQQIKFMYQYGDGYIDMSSAHREALDMIAHKLGRIICGDPNYADSWHDIAGYAILGEQACVADND